MKANMSDKAWRAYVLASKVCIEAKKAFEEAKKTCAEAEKTYLQAFKAEKANAEVNEEVR